MIQRIQSLFLLVAFILNVSFFFLPLYEAALLDPSAWVTNTLTAALIVAAALSLYSIFLFRDRSKQLRFVRLALIMQIVALGSAVGLFFTMGRITTLWDEALGVGILLIAVICCFLAIRYIQKDEELVRSMDRIR